MEMASLREAYGKALVELGAQNKNIVALDADLSKSTRTALFQEAYPERFFEISIAEQNMIGVAVGLALTGKIPFVNSFAVFATGRTYDQIRQSACIANINIKICGSSSGLSDFGDGATHQSLEDVALMRVLPNMTVLVPVDAVETKKMVEFAVRHNGPVYLRINRNDLPVYTDESTEFELGKLYQMRDGEDAVVFANGVMVSKAMEAAEILEKEGTGVRVVNVSTVKPLKKDEVLKYIKGVKGIVTAEEHSIIGGLGSAIVELLRDVDHPPVEFIGVKDRFGTSASNYEELLEYFGLTSKSITLTIKNLLDRC
ncbi:MAG: transketolase family protein [Dictyoglomi bacterium]|nr:transketolase family protein [Dictyoglomota bacterium]HOK29155.1 transketolase family protein [bacterium]HOL55110.1 transketolase family protein [bacterium]